MAIDKPIFAPRTKLNEKLRPTQQALHSFLENMNKDGTLVLHADDLERYRKLLHLVEAFERVKAQAVGQVDLRDQLYFRVLSHTRFINPSLPAEVELYKYLHHSLAVLQFEEPMEFIQSAQKSMAKLNVKKIDDVMRMARLKQMVAERQKILDELKKRWVELTSELRAIALYVREGLVRIEKICGASVAVLANEDAVLRKEQQLIEDVKAYFKERLKSALHGGQVTKQDLEKAKQEVDELSREIADIVREDVESLISAYDAIRDHTKKSEIELAVLLADIESKKSGTLSEKRELYKRVEQTLVSLVKDYRLELRSSKLSIKPAHVGIVSGKRKELHDYLFELVQKERRARPDRRTPKDRRKTVDPNYRGPERRQTKDRRGVKGRRG